MNFKDKLEDVENNFKEESNNKSFYDIFLIACFKLIKILTSIFLFILLLTAVIAGINTVYQGFQSQNLKLNYKASANFEQEYKNGEKNQNIDWQKTFKNTEVEYFYNTQILKILKENGVNEDIASFYMEQLKTNIEPRDRKDFIDNLSQYYKDMYNLTKKQIKEEYPYVSDREIEIYMKRFKNTEIHNKYMLRYNREVEHRQMERKSYWLKSGYSLAIVLLCITLFINTLILPILLRIEENTRK